MKKYRSLFHIRFVQGLQYRLAALAGLFTQFAWGFMSILLYRAFYRSNPAAFPMEFSQYASYVWLHESFFVLFAPHGLDRSVFEQITSGDIAYQLVQPIDLYNRWFFENLAGRISGVLLRCIPVLLLAVLLPAPYGLSAPASGESLLLALWAAGMAVLLVVSLSILIYLLTMHTLSPSGPMALLYYVVGFLGGSFLPIPFMPAPIQQIIELLPFGLMENLPYRIYSGHIHGSELTRLLTLQAGWVLVMILLGRLWCRREQRRLVVQGG